MRFLGTKYAKNAFGGRGRMGREERREKVIPVVLLFPHFEPCFHHKQCKPGLAGCLRFIFSISPKPCMLTGQTKTFHILLDSVIPSLP